MQVAILSDIHGNRHAFEAVLARRPSAAARRRSGAWATSSATAPTPTTASRSRASTARSCLAGNHDLAVTGDLVARRVLRAAPRSPRAGRRRSSTPSTAILAGLAAPAGPMRGHRPLPRQSRATRSGSTSSPRCSPSCASTPSPSASALVGHSHVALSFVRPEGEPATGGAPRRATRSPTSAAASGSSTPAASASRATAIRAPPGCCSTPTRWTATWRRAEYDIAGAAAAIRAARLPDSLAERLEYGQ